MIYLDALRDVAMQNLRDLADFLHHIGKLLWVDRLRTVRESLVRLVMDLNDETIGTYSYGGPR